MNDGEENNEENRSDDALRLYDAGPGWLWRRGYSGQQQGRHLYQR